MSLRWFRARLTLRAKLLLLDLVVGVALAVLAGHAWFTSSRQDAAQARQLQWNLALQANKQADMVHDSLRAGVLSALLVGEVPNLEHVDILRQVTDDARELDEALRLVAQAPLPDDLTARAARARTTAQAYAAAAVGVVESAGRQRAAAVAALPSSSAGSCSCRRNSAICRSGSRRPCAPHRPRRPPTRRRRASRCCGPSPRRCCSPRPSWR